MSSTRGPNGFAAIVREFEKRPGRVLSMFSAEVEKLTCGKD